MRTPGPLPQPQPGYSQGWANALVQKLEGFFGGLAGDWTCKGKLTTQSARCKKVTSVTDATYTVLLTDDVVDVNRAGTVTLTMPVGPSRGHEITVQDGGGNAGTYTITVTKASDYNINGGSTKTITANYGRVTFVFNGTQWVGA